MSRTATLQRLQHADDHVAALRGEMATIEAALRGDPELDRRRARASETSSARQQSEEELSESEKALSALELRVKTLNRRLYDGSVKNPHELLEMQHELETLRAQVGTLEDQLLVVLESSEGAARDAQAAAGAVTELEEQRDADTELRRRRLAVLRDLLAESVEERDALAREAGSADLALYNRVAALHRPAVVALNGDSCGGCHLPVSNEERRAVRTGPDVVQCSNCDRILVP